MFKEPADGRDALRRALGSDSVIVSEAFATKYGTKPGDILTSRLRLARTALALLASITTTPLSAG